MTINLPPYKICVVFSSLKPRRKQIEPKRKYSTRFYLYMCKICCDHLFLTSYKIDDDVFMPKKKNNTHQKITSQSRACAINNLCSY